jgi:hypothetical protein
MVGSGGMATCWYRIPKRASSVHQVMEVGLRINELARASKGQDGSRRGWQRDAIIVDEEADLAAAVGVALSAYGYQGQKCSACSRAIVSEAA